MKKGNFSDFRLKPSKFCETFLNIKLTPQQKIILDSKRRNLVTLAARKVGQSYCNKLRKQWEKYFRKVKK